MPCYLQLNIITGYFTECLLFFCGINNFKDSLIEKYRKWFTGIAEETDVEGTINIALRLHPDTKRVYVINDITTTGLAMKKNLLEIFPKFSDKVNFILLENPDMKELQKEVEKNSSKEYNSSFACK